jgi:hypothetical protein
VNRYFFVSTCVTNDGYTFFKNNEYSFFRYYTLIDKDQIEMWKSLRTILCRFKNTLERKILYAKIISNLGLSLFSFFIINNKVYKLYYRISLVLETLNLIVLGLEFYLKKHFIL